MKCKGLVCEAECGIPLLTMIVFLYYVCTGIVAQAPRLNLAQLSFTHPGMFPYFGFDREWLFRNQYKPGGPGVMSQTQAGLMLVDAANTTMRETFFQEWADCAANDDCLIPDKVIIDKRPPHALAIFNISGHRVFR